MSLRVVLAFPWRPTQDRLEPFQITLGRVRMYFDFTAIIAVDSKHPRFNRCASRNRAVETATRLFSADVVVLCDADSVPDQPLQIQDAIYGAYRDDLMHFPFDEAWYIDWKGMLRVKQQHTSEQIKSRIFDKCASEGGVWVCKPETWWKAGGQDERLANWGCDDRAFLAASRTMVGDPFKHPGVLYCLPHDRPTSEEVWIPEEVQLLIEYQNRYQQPVEMQKFIDSRPKFPDYGIDIEIIKGL